LVIIIYTNGLSFAEERIRPLAAIITTIFYLLALYLFALPNIPENPFAIIYSESLIKITSQHLLLLVGFKTLIYQKYYDTPPILVGHHAATSTSATPTTTSTTVNPHTTTSTKVAAPTALGFLDIGTRAITSHDHSSASSIVQASVTQLCPRRSCSDCGGRGRCQPIGFYTFGFSPV
jgi:hypothetical protein